MSINNYILKSDQIFCANQQDVINGYIIIHDNRIHAIEKGYIPSSLENQYKVYDLSGKTILPGFFDAHTFFTGWSLRYIGIDLSNAKTEKEVIEVLKHAIPIKIISLVMEYLIILTPQALKN